MPSALVLGCAKCVWDDAKAAHELFEPDAVFAVKNMMVEWPGRIDYGITLHPDRTSGYMRERVRAGRPIGFEVWTYNQKSNHAWAHRIANDWAGSSGLFAVRVAIKEGFDRIVLAGVPMLAEYGHIARGHDWHEAKNYRQAWHRRLPEIKQIVRSMSGWTRELLGEPTPQWLCDENSVHQNREIGTGSIGEWADGQDQDHTG